MDPEQIKELESLMEDYSTIPNYQDIPTTIIPPYLTKPLWKHQLQAIYRALESEASGPTILENGDVMSSDSGIVCLSTGVGKTAIMLGISNFSVGERSIDKSIVSTSLNTIILNRPNRTNIDVTVICAKSRILNDAWIPNIKKFYPDLPYYVFDTIGTFKKDAMRSKEYQSYSQQVEIIKMQFARYYNALTNGQITQSQFELDLSVYGDIRTGDDIRKYQKTLDDKLAEKLQEAINQRLISIMSSVKVFLVSETSFYFLFDFFKDYTISRLVLDEPQNTVYENQKFFKDYIKDEKLKYLRSVGLGKMLPYPELSPCRFLWYVSATPQLIPDNNNSHYFNSWVAKNDFVISDYATNKEEDRKFPELVERYVIKFPYSYILESRPDFASLINKYTLKSRRNAEFNIIRGVLGEEIDHMIENDDYEGIIEKISTGGSANDILDMTCERLELDIKKLASKISTYDPKTPQHIIDKSTADLDEKKKNLVELRKKIDRYKAKQNTSSEECPICYEILNIVPRNGDRPEDRCVCHINCMNIFHLGCISKVLKSQNKTCPMCSLLLKEEDIRPTFDGRGNNIQMQLSLEDQQKTRNKAVSHPTVEIFDVNKVYDSKLDSLKACLGPMIRNGQYYNRSKILLFIDFKKDESIQLNTIVTLCQDCGYNVRLPFIVGNKDLLLQKFPIRNGCRVEQGKAAKAIKKEIKDFETSRERFVWIFRSEKESAGLNFPFVDTSIEYSDFKSHKQIIGRSLRMDRVLPVDLFRLDYE